jgi:hypothetical protein
MGRFYTTPPHARRMPSDAVNAVVLFLDRAFVRRSAIMSLVRQYNNLMAPLAAVMRHARGSTRTSVLSSDLEPRARHGGAAD